MSNRIIILTTIVTRRPIAVKCTSLVDCSYTLCGTIFYAFAGMVSVRCSVPTRLRHGHLVDRVSIVRGWNGEYFGPRIIGSRAWVHLCRWPFIGLRRRMAGRLRYAGYGLRVDTGDYRCTNDHHTRFTVLPDDGG